MENDQINPELVNWKKRFFTIWSGQAVSMLGSRLAGFAFVWYLTATTGSATVLAMGTLFSMLPDVIITPIAGALVDRLNRKTVLIVFDALTALVTLILALLFAFTEVQIWQIYLVFFLRSTFGSFQWTAMLTSTSLMVPKEQLARVSGMNQTLNGIMGILAPPMGAFLVGILSMSGILMIDVVTALLAIVPLFFFHLPQPVRSKAQKDDNGKIKFNLWHDLVEGFRYVGTLPGLMMIILIAMLINFVVSPAFSLLPILVTGYFQKGAIDLGIMESVFSIGFVVGCVLLSIWGGFKNRLVTTMSFLILMGISITLIGFVPANLFYLATSFLVLAGITNPLVNGPLMAALQARVDPEKQGRVFSLLHAGAVLATPIGLAIAGPVSDAIGVQVWFIIGGLVCVLMAVISFMNPKVIELGRVVETSTTQTATKPTAEYGSEI